MKTGQRDEDTQLPPVLLLPRSSTAFVNCGIKGEDVTAEGLGWAAGMGVVSGVIGGSGVDAASKGAVLDVAQSVITNSSSAKKVAMYVAKRMATNKKIVEGIARTAGSIVVPNVLNGAKNAALNY